MREKFKKGEIVSATRTFNGEIITGEFQGYHLFNDEIPDTVVGVVHVPGDGVYDVDVTSLRHCVKSTRYSDDEDDRIIQNLIDAFTEYKKSGGVDFHGIEINTLLAWLEKRKEEDKCPEYCVRSHCIGCSIYEKEKEKWPIMDVFGFKVGDAVRLKDGDGRKHIIKAFEEIEGVHGPNFYHVEFEDNSARDGIYPGEEYPNGYYTQMEKLEEEQKPINESNMHEPTLDEARKWNEAYEKGYSLGYENGRNEQKPVEWSKEDDLKLGALITDIETRSDLTEAIKIKYVSFLKSLRPQPKQEWSEEDEETLACAISVFEDFAECKNVSVPPASAKRYLKRLKSLRPSWKPSEEQMKALRECGECKRCIKELYEDLQKRYGTC